MTPLKRASVRDLWFLSLVMLIFAGFGKDFASLVRFSFANDLYSYIILIPVVSVALAARQKDAIFRDVGWGWGPGIGLMAAGLAGAVLQRRFWHADPAASLAATMLCALALLTGTFALCYGKRAVRAAAFPILFLILIVPVPARMLDAASLLLQRASYELTYGMITGAGVPVLRHGFVLSLQAGSIFIGPECSGIRSTLGLLVGGIVAGHLFLRSFWKKVLLGFLVVPVSIFKNALRITTLYYLGVHTDQRFLTGELHRIGGIPFSLIALAILGPLLWALRKSEFKVMEVKVEAAASKSALILPAAGPVLGE
ncbi:MAG: exosortase/archaeosortase family protein [Terriglobia bacterium]